MLVLLSLGLMLTLASCSQEKPDRASAEPRASTGQEEEIGPEFRTDPMDWRLSVRGAVSLDVSVDAIPIKTARLLDDRVAQIKYFGLEPAGWVDVGRDDARVKASVNILNFNGDGTYRIGPPSVGRLEPGEATPQTATGVSNARLDYLEGDGTKVYRVFAMVEKPCTVSVRRSGAEGEMRCEAISDGHETVSLDMSWG